MTFQRFAGSSHGKNRRAPLRAGQIAPKPEAELTGYALCRARHGECSCEAQGMKPCVAAVAEVLGK